jgi:hypothetical protein
VPAVAARHFLADPDAHADHHSQHLAQPATVDERSDRQRVKHGYPDRERLQVADR